MPRLSLFSAFGIELEYMIVDATTLNVRPIADELLRAATGELTSDYERGAIAWSNELARHVIELKTNGPTSSLASLAGEFQENVVLMNELLSPFGARLMPTAMHPWMNPDRELELWPHDYHAIYETFNRIFDCRGHGWANLQSMHINLPFANDDEFGRLHAAIRLVLPLLPGLAASSPIVEGVVTGTLDNRLNMYRTNARRMASVTGRVIPEQAFSEAEYDRQIFQPMYAEIAPYDPEGHLQEEFLNARGAIARFSRGAIEIRLIDVQESPQADVAIAAVVIEVLRSLVREQFTSLGVQQGVTIDPLERLLLETIQLADGAIVDDRDYLSHFGLADLVGGTVGDVWQRLIQRTCTADGEFDATFGETLNAITQRGPLARRIVRELAESPAPPQLREVYGELCDRLQSGTLFT